MDKGKMHDKFHGQHRDFPRTDPDVLLRELRNHFLLFGLAPIILEKSLQAQFLIPMAVSLSSGVAFATFLTLFLVPALTLIREDFLNLGRRLRALAFEPEGAEPAPAESRPG